ncbi:MAG: 4Fe-4S binding protein [Pseudomonadota bacterium]
MDADPGAEVVVFYRDIMTPGSAEALYTSARIKGASFIPYHPGKKPEVIMENGRPTVVGFDPVLGEEVRLSPDLVVLSSGLTPGPHRDLARVFGVEITSDGFLKEADYKWRPVDSSREGVLVCGLGRAPMTADEAVKEGRAAALRAFRFLSRDVLPVPATTARVRPGLCSLCRVCLAVCPFNARSLDLAAGRVIVDPAACQGCGACAAACPNSAAVLGDYNESGLMAAIEAML